MAVRFARVLTVASQAAVFIVSFLGAPVEASQTSSPAPVPTGASTTAPTSTPSGPITAVLGSSTAREVILDGSPVPCGYWLTNDTKKCIYQDASPFAYPVVLETLMPPVLNLSFGGAQAADMKTSGTIPTVLDSQVPQIPVDTAFVVLDIGTMDISINGAVEIVLSRADRVVAAIRARAPKAKILLLGVRYFETGYPTRIDAWDERDQAIAASVPNVKFLDLRKVFPASDHVDFPDGTHMSQNASKKIAQMIAAALKSM
jgi:lysophospholipase L1-like esterase